MVTSESMATVRRRLAVGFVASAVVAAIAVHGRLLPRHPNDGHGADWRPAVLDVCRTTVRDVQPFVAVVYLLTADDDGLLRLVHETVGATVLLWTDGDEPPRMDSQVALVIADGPDAVLAAVDGGRAEMWDPMSHYVWLVPAAGSAAAKTLFRAAWRRRRVIQAVLVARTVAYTYDPFRDALDRRRPVDADALRTVARRKMADLNGHTVRVCMFPTRLKAVQQPDGTYKGTDGIVVATLAKHMNFKPEYRLPSDGKKYGWAESISESNYTYTGLLGDLVHNKVDMAFNGAFLNVIVGH